MAVAAPERTCCERKSRPPQWRAFAGSAGGLYATFLSLSIRRRSISTRRSFATMVVVGGARPGRFDHRAVSAAACSGTDIDHIPTTIAAAARQLIMGSCHRFHVVCPQGSPVKNYEPT